MNNFIALFSFVLSIAAASTVSAENIANSQGNSELSFQGTREKPTLLTVNLSTYEIHVSRDGKELAKYPISYGGPSLLPECKDEEILPTKKCPRPPRECKTESPPTGEFEIKSSSKTYKSHVLNQEYENVVQFGDFFVIRSIKAGSRAVEIGKPQFTCGQIVLRTADSEKIFRAIDGSKPENFRVKVIKN